MTPRARRLLRWYRRHRRRLPWRENPTPYRVWLSELMLQQTQVKTVLRYFERFIERFPDVGALARASEQDVLAAWSGLGYYRRARALHEAARRIVNDRGGRFPKDVESWMKLPGVGRYTAGAVVSIAFGKRAPILDGNVTRVLARWFAVPGDPRRGETQRRLWSLAEEVLPDRSVSEFNQALMELGALLCTPRDPRCLKCPVSSECEARSQGREEAFPETSARPASVRVTMAAAVVERRGRLLMFQRSSDGLMKDLWEFPGCECPPGEDPRTWLAREASASYGLTLRADVELARVKHSIMNRRIDLYAFAADVERLPRMRKSRHRWVAPDEIDSIPVSSMIPKLLRAIEKKRR